MNSNYSPHIFVYKPQINSVFSLFFRFSLILVFIDFLLRSLDITFFNSFVFNYWVDLVYFSEFILAFYILASLSEDFIDYDDLESSYWDIDLITFFWFFFTFSCFFAAFSLIYLTSKFSFWTALIVC